MSLILVVCIASLIIGTPFAHAGTIAGSITVKSLVCDGEDVVITWTFSMFARLSWAGTSFGTYDIPNRTTGEESYRITGPGTFIIEILDTSSMPGSTIYGPQSITCASNPVVVDPTPANPTIPVPPDPLANWNGNPNSPTYDGRLNGTPADPFALYCIYDTLQIFNAEGALATTGSLVDIQTMDPAGSSFDLENGFTVGRSGDSITVANAASGFSKEFSLARCLDLNTAANPKATDRRLNPEPQEYYTVYCELDFILLYRGSGTLLHAMPIADVIHMNDDGHTMDIGNGMTITRSGSTIAFSGNNGNAAGPGSKSFSLSECLQRNADTSS